jgi:hypothetical protein
MKITLATSIFICLVGGCGSKTLDIGGPSGGGASVGDSGRPGEPAPGTHSTVLLPHQGETMTLVSEGSYLYWKTRGVADSVAIQVPDPTISSGGGVIRRCEKHDCPGTQQTLVSGPPFGSGSPLVIRNETLYFYAFGGSILSCPVSDCTAPTVVVAHGGSVILIVDDSHVYWEAGTDNAFLSCPLTGCEKATAAPATGSGRLIGADDDNLYWLTESSLSKYSIKSAPKDGSALPNVLVSDLLRPGAFVVDGGFVYWVTLGPKGAIARCPTSGCSGGAPEVLVDRQYYPHHLTVSDGALFWLNETDPDKLTAINRPAKLLGCVAANCAESVEVLDEAREGSLFGPIDSSWARPEQKMVADSEAVYWFSDVTNVAPSGSNVTPMGADEREFIIDTSIRKWVRKPGK